MTGRPTGLSVAAQFALCLAFVQWHAFARFLAAGSAEDGVRHAEAVIGWERAAGVYVEAAIQGLALGEPLLSHLFVLVYSIGHIAAPIAALGFLFCRDQARFRSWRNTLGLTAVLALPVFWLWPLAPPRFMPPPDQLVDLVAVNPTVLDLGGPIAPALFNGFAAMPSLHCAFALWAALATVPLLRSVGARVAVSAYPALMTAATVATGNHFLFDAVGAVAVLGVARVAVVGIERWRGLPLHAAQAVARRAQTALGGAVFVVWLPRAQWTTLAVAVLVVGVVEVMRQHEQSVPGLRVSLRTADDEPSGPELRPALPDVG